MCPCISSLCVTGGSNLQPLQVFPQNPKFQMMYNYYFFSNFGFGFGFLKSETRHPRVWGYQTLHQKKYGFYARRRQLFLLDPQSYRIIFIFNRCLHACIYHDACRPILERIVIEVTHTNDNSLLIKSALDSPKVQF